MKVSDGIRICKHIGDSTYLKAEKIDAIITVMKSASGTYTFNKIELSALLEYVFDLYMELKENDRDT